MMLTCYGWACIHIKLPRSSGAELSSSHLDMAVTFHASSGPGAGRQILAITTAVCSPWAARPAIQLVARERLVRVLGFSFHFGKFARLDSLVAAAGGADVDDVHHACPCFRDMAARTTCPSERRIGLQRSDR